jgi:hypothetical protein
MGSGSLPIMNRFEDVDDVAMYLVSVREREGPEVAKEKAKLIISAAAALIAHDHGPEETRRILRIVAEAQGNTP